MEIPGKKDEVEEEEKELIPSDNNASTFLRVFVAATVLSLKLIHSNTYQNVPEAR